jgi:hypothetical protein
MKPLDMKKVKKGKILGADSLGLLCSYAPPNCTVPFGLVLGMTRLFACLLLEYSNLQYTWFKNKLSPPVRNLLSLGKFISLSHSDIKKKGLRVVFICSQWKQPFLSYRITRRVGS